MEPPPPHAERASPTTPAPVAPIDTTNLILQEILISAQDTLGQQASTSPLRRASTSPVLYRTESEISSLNRSPRARDASSSKLSKRASIQIMGSSTDSTKGRLTRAPSISVPNLDRTQFDKDVELVLFIDQLKADLNRSQQEVAKLQKKLVDRTRGIDEEKVAQEHTRYLEEKVRHLEAENARLKQQAQRHQLHDSDKRRLHDLESALLEAKRTEERALHLVVAAIGKARLESLLNNPSLADLSLEDRVAAACTTATRAKFKSKLLSTTSAASSPRPSSKDPRNLNDMDALEARSKQLDLLWKQHCSELHTAPSSFTKSLRQ
ncbi:hypothetical protein H310_00590 [Aphanomyces invadans]|uniref:Uncharacterized protein n=1 Tax=Aphanomyces invadans TaxID=157072 RepID=A0A024UUN8_9STRA|nr:hypothetical protein H310_00590 [Aphanomyces invadans]ETW10236.1 hypothetical protein H310_00590 [Aphanomyces invadans]|eukprot:XP_008861647.1 hypothetical protein H310_00590 [Aphanomyces invadans]